MSWHAGSSLLETYSLGVLDDAQSASVEAHLLRCETCRQAAAALVPRDRLDRMWTALEDRTAPQPGGLTERLLVRLGMPDHVARLLAATRSLRLSWFGAIAVALAFAVSAAKAGRSGLLVFLIVAPLIPVAGVAAAYGPGVDPTYEVGLAAPMRSFRLLFLRAASVIGTSTILVGAAALALPHLGWTAAAWLLPSFGLSAATLALSSYWPVGWVTSIVVAVWIGVAVAAEGLSTVRLAAFRAGPQVAFAILAVISIAALGRRRDAFDARRRA